MRAALVAAAALAAALAAPVAAALDAFPGHERFDAHEARLLVRLPNGGMLRVATDPPVEVAFVPPGGAPVAWATAPSEAVVTTGKPESSWHGLPGTVEVVLRRAERDQEVRVEVEDGGGAGAEYVWPASPAPAKRLPAPAAPLAALALASAALVAASFKRPRAERGAVCASR